MSKAYVLINVRNHHRLKEIVGHLSQKKGVQSAEAVFGPHDVIAMIEGQDLKDLSHTVVNDLYDLGHIESSTTCIVIE